MDAMRLILRTLILPSMIILLASLVSAHATGARARDESHVAVTLVSEQTTLVPGKTAWLGIRLKHQRQWHTYWVNPGDSGLPTKLHWDLPPGFKAGEIAWPAPQRFTSAQVYNFGYADQVLLPVPIEIPASAKPGARARLAIEAKWLVCHEECVPGKATLSLSLPIAAQAAPERRWSKPFADARAKQPQPAAWSADAKLAGERIDVVLRGAGLPAAEMLDAFTPQMRVFAYAPPRVSQDGDALRLSFAKSEYFAAPTATLDLILTSSAPPARVWSITAPLTTAPEASTQP